MTEIGWLCQGPEARTPRRVAHEHTYSGLWRDCLTRPRGAVSRQFTSSRLWDHAVLTTRSSGWVLHRARASHWFSSSPKSISTLWPRRSFKTGKLAVCPPSWRCLLMPPGPSPPVVFHALHIPPFSTPPSQAQKLCPFPEHSSHLPCSLLRRGPHTVNIFCFVLLCVGSS